MKRLIAVLAGLSMIAVPVAAGAEKLRIAVPQKGVWETGLAELGAMAGYFKAEGIELEPLYTRGGSETVQAVLAGSVDIAVSNGLLGTLGGFSKGAPIRVTAASITGSPDVFWYARADSDIKTINDAAGKAIGYSQPGSSTHLIIQALLDHFKVKAKLVASGSPSGSFTMTMSQQIDLGWSTPPFRLQEIADGKVRIVVRGSDAPQLANQTIRVHVTSAQTLRAKRDLLVRFHRALHKSMDYAYSSDKALEDYAKVAKTTVPVARQVRDEFYPKQAMQMKEIRGLDQSLKQALDFKFIDRPMKVEELKEMIDILAP